MAKKRKGLTATIVATILGSALFAILIQKAPSIETSFPVSSPSTRGFGAPCDGSDFTSTPILKFGPHTWNKGAVLAMRAVNETIARLDIWTPSVFNGTYNCRTISGSSSYSHHAWSLALDVDASQNSLGTSPTYCEINRTRHPDFIHSFTRYGFYWGGDFSSRPDCMHFEWDGPVLTNAGNRFPDGFDAHNFLARLLIANGLPGVKDGQYTGLKEETAVLAFQKKNGLLKIEPHGIVGPATLTLLELGAA